MDFFRVLGARRSVRDFSSQPVPPRTIAKLVAAATQAPSSMDGRPWRFLVIRDQAMKGRLARFKDKWCPAAKREYSAEFLAAAPVVLVVCVDRRRSYDRWVENGTIAATYVLLAAAALGLGGTFMTAYHLRRPAQARELRRLLRLPAALEAICILPLGFPAGRPRPKPLPKPQDIIHLERF